MLVLYSSLFITWLLFGLMPNSVFYGLLNCGEYLSSSLSSIFYESGIIHQTTCLGTPKKNRVVERKNRHLLEIVRAIICSQ